MQPKPQVVDERREEFGRGLERVFITYCFALIATWSSGLLTIIPRSFSGRRSPMQIGHTQNCFTLDNGSSISLHCLLHNSRKLLSHGRAISPNQSLEPSAGRCEVHI